MVLLDEAATGIDGVDFQGAGFLDIARCRLGSITIYDPSIVVMPTNLAFVAKSEQYTGWQKGRKRERSFDILI